MGGRALTPFCRRLLHINIGKARARIPELGLFCGYICHWAWELALQAKACALLDTATVLVLLLVSIVERAMSESEDA